MGSDAQVRSVPLGGWVSRRHLAAEADCTDSVRGRTLTVPLRRRDLRPKGTMNDYEQAVADITAAIDACETIDTVDHDIETLVVAAIDKLDDAKVLAEGRV